MQEQSTKNNDNCKDPTHELWLIYCQLKQAETEPEAREQIISSARYQLGRVLNALNHFRFELKSPGNQAAKLNCRDRQKDLTPDILIESETVNAHSYIINSRFNGNGLYAKASEAADRRN